MRKFIFIIFYLLGIVCSSFGQSTPVDSLRVDFDKMYGLDVLLHNGRKYFSDNKPVKGHPFWRSKEPFLGDVTVSGKTFRNVRLMYNINRQEFILDYSDFNGQQIQIILNSEIIDSVKTGTFLFESRKYQEIKQPFVQLVYQKKLSCFIGWYKELNFNSTGNNVGYKYSDDNCIYYLIYKGVVYQFTNKSSFLNVFPVKERLLIRKYLSANRIKFKKLDEGSLKKLIHYCEEIVV